MASLADEGAAEDLRDRPGGVARVAQPEPQEEALRRRSRTRPADSRRHVADPLDSLVERVGDVEVSAPVDGDAGRGLQPEGRGRPVEALDRAPR